MVIAIDGTSGSGKSTIARLLSERLGIELLNTGLIYRKIARHCVDRGIGADDEAAIAGALAGIDFKGLRGEDLHAEEVSRAVPGYARHERVREFVRGIQRGLAAGKSIIVEGRDIGTVVFPNAELKLFVDASLEERARRRMRQLGVEGDAALAGIKANLESRDRHDKARDASPLRVPEGAIVVDTTNRGVEEILAEIAASLPRPS